MVPVKFDDTDFLLGALTIFYGILRFFHAQAEDRCPDVIIIIISTFKIEDYNVFFKDIRVHENDIF